MATQKISKAPLTDQDIAIVRIAPEASFKNKAYDALKEAILKNGYLCVARAGHAR